MSTDNFEYYKYSKNENNLPTPVKYSEEYVNLLKKNINKELTHGDRIKDPKTGRILPKYDPKKIEKICSLITGEDVRIGVPQACAEVGYSYDTFMLYLTYDPDMEERYHNALEALKANRKSFAEMKIFEAMSLGPKYWTAAAWYLEKVCTEYRKDSNITNVINNEIQNNKYLKKTALEIQKLTDEELKNLIDGEINSERKENEK